MFHNALAPWHLLVVALVVIVLFGSKKLPDAARGLGKSLRILKSEARAMKEDGTAQPAPAPSTGDPEQTAPRITQAAPESASPGLVRERQ
ncbi:Sec-independent protein translocase subunit TatA [Streptomyces sp. NPDC059479]|uniref:Sec-independent protein translocase subunit TatA n=1 Tax=Streptomyces sp. NPDC059479 TaxID=3346848 RepID=UPI0036B049C7